MATASGMIAAMPAYAQQVGTATAVNPTTDSTAPGGATKVLTVGATIVHKEHVHTTSSGSVQLRFLDKSSLSVGPNSNLVIDEFVYDPDSHKGHMLATLTKGALRYVGGELSHQGDTTIATSNANIGIRGGTATVIQGPNGTEVINHFGTLTISNNKGTITIDRPGFEVIITGLNVPIGQPVQVTADKIDHYIRHLTSKFGQNGGKSGFNGAGYAICGTPTTQACPQPPWQQTNTGENNGFQIILESTQRGTGQTMPTSPPPPPPPPPIGRAR